MRTLRTLLVSAALGASLASLAPRRAKAQALHTVGGFVGRTDSRQTWSLAPDARHRLGIEVGAFVDVPAGSKWFSVMAEAAYVQRGARLPLGTGGNGATLYGDVRVDYLSAAILPALHLTLGPVSIFGYAGPGMDTHLDTRTAPGLGPAYMNDKAQVLLGEAGAGVEILLRGRWCLRGEIRESRDATSAFTDAPGDIKFRSTEILLRFGVRSGPR